MRPVPLATRTPYIAVAVALHGFVAALAYASFPMPRPVALPEEPEFHLALGPRVLLPDTLMLPAAWPGYGGLPRATPPDVLLREIEREIAALGRDHPWAGEYSARGKQLSIAPRCGSWLEERGSTLTASVDCTEFDGKWWIVAGDRAYVPVNWGRRHYLIEQNEWTPFVMAVRSGAEPRRQSYGQFLLRTGDELVSVEDERVTIGAP